MGGNDAKRGDDAGEGAHSSGSLVSCSVDFVPSLVVSLRGELGWRGEPRHLHDGPGVVRDVPHDRRFRVSARFVCIFRQSSQLPSP